MQRVARLIVDIANASAQQSGDIVRVNETITALDQVTQPNAALVEESAAAAASLRQQAARLTDDTAIFSTEDSMPN